MRLQQRKQPPFEFVWTRSSACQCARGPCSAASVYVRPKVVLLLRDKPADTDNGVWLATTANHHESLCAEFPSMRSIVLLGNDVTGWQVLPVDAPDFEQAVVRACALVRSRDPRIGKAPKKKRR